MFTNMWKWRILHSTRIMLLCPWIHRSFLFQWYISFINNIYSMHDQVRCTISFNSEVFILHNIIKAFHLNLSVQWFLDKQFIFCSDIVIVSIILLTKIILYQNVKHFYINYRYLQPTLSAWRNLCCSTAV